MHKSLAQFSAFVAVIGLVILTGCRATVAPRELRSKASTVRMRSPASRFCSGVAGAVPASRWRSISTKSRMPASP